MFSSFNLRSITQIIAWVMLSSIFFINLFGLFARGDNQTQKTEIVTEDRLSNFARSFVYEWLTINADEAERDYRNRLLPFVPPSLITSRAGMDLSNSIKSQKVENAWMESYTQLDSTHFMVNVGTYLVTSDSRRHWLVHVPIAVDPRTKKLAIYASPSVSPLYQPPDVSDIDFGKPTTVRDKQQLMLTLNNFFEKYLSSDTPADLSNYLAEHVRGTIQPKAGVLQFIEVINIDVHPGPSSDEDSKNYLVKAKVATKDVVMDNVITSDYLLMVREDGNKYLVEKITP